MKELKNSFLNLCLLGFLGLNTVSVGFVVDCEFICLSACQFDPKQEPIPPITQPQDSKLVNLNNSCRGTGRRDILS